jgi:hypothetical protein
VFTFTLGDTLVVDDPETGLLRITVNGDWTNAGPVSAAITVFSTTEPVPQFTAQGKIGQGQTIAVPVTVPAGVSRAEFRAGWREDWGSYPTNDVDLLLVRPDGTLLTSGATLNNPEVVVVTNPPPGQWVALIDGFEVATGSDKFEFRAALDGVVVK